MPPESSEHPVAAVPPRLTASAGAAYTLAQKIVGRACGADGVAPGTYCEPIISTVGSQDTTGPMNRTELEELACLEFGADLVLQSFCHTATYPKPADIETQRTLPAFMQKRGGVVLRPGDGIIHSWINRLLLPDQVGTGSDSHTRFPLGISFPAGSGLVAFAAALGVMPIDMPESVLVRFSGRPRAGITLRDLVHAIPYEARRQGLLTLDPTSKHNVFAGRIVEIEGLERLSVEQAFELSDSTAERSAAACTIVLCQESVERHLRSSVALVRQLVDAGYQDARTVERRGKAMEAWLAKPTLLQADPGATYAAVIDIDASSITEPLVACPNDPDDVRRLSEVEGRPVDEVFIGSCMTRVGHFRSAGSLLAAHDLPVSSRLCDHATDQTGPGGAAGRGLLQQVRRRPGTNRDTGLLALHGQPGSGEPRVDGGIDLYPELRQPYGEGRPGLPGVGGAGDRSRHSRSPAVGR